MRAVAALIVLVLVACGSDEPKRPAEHDQCQRGEATACFVAGSRFDPTKQPELAKAIEYYERGCSLGHGASCAQLGTVAEYGMRGGEPDPMGAALFYRRACAHGDKGSCKKIGEKVDEPAAKFPWREALTPICGKQRATLGPLFDGLELGKPMPVGMAERIAAYEKTFKAHVHYYAGDPILDSLPALDVRFDEPKGLGAVLASGWGKPDLDWGAWSNTDAHLFASAGSDGRSASISFGPFRSVDELVAPSDPAKLGFEPVPVIGAKVAGVKAALGQLKQVYEDEYRWNQIGPGPNFYPRLIVKRGTIVKLDADIITNSPKIGDEFLAALATKWGPPKIRKGVHTWQLEGRRVTASKPASGNLRIIVERR